MFLARKNRSALTHDQIALPFRSSTSLGLRQLAMPFAFRRMWRPVTRTLSRRVGKGVWSLKLVKRRGSTLRNSHKHKCAATVNFLPAVLGTEKINRSDLVT